MKIGVALSGCDIGGVCSYSLLHQLKEDGLEPDYISACGLASIGALLYTCSFDPEQCRFYADGFLKTYVREDLDSAIAQLCDGLGPKLLSGISGLAVSAINITDGKTIAFSNDLSFSTNTLRTYPIQDAYDMLSATAGGVQGLASYLLRGERLSDYSVRFGHPLYPLQMMGMQNIFSFSFLPAVPGSSYDILLGQKLEVPPRAAAEHINIAFPPPAICSAAEYEEIAISEYESCKNNCFIALAQ